MKLYKSIEVVNPQGNLCERHSFVLNNNADTWKAWYLTTLPSATLLGTESFEAIPANASIYFHDYTNLKIQVNISYYITF